MPLVEKLFFLLRLHNFLYALHIAWNYSICNKRERKNWITSLFHKIRRIKIYHINSQIKFQQIFKSLKKNLFFLTLDENYRFKILIFLFKWMIMICSDWKVRKKHFYLFHFNFWFWLHVLKTVERVQSSILFSSWNCDDALEWREFTKIKKIFKDLFWNYKFKFFEKRCVYKI